VKRIAWAMTVGNAVWPEVESFWHFIWLYHDQKQMFSLACER